MDSMICPRGIDVITQYLILKSVQYPTVTCALIAAAAAAASSSPLLLTILLLLGNRTSYTRRTKRGSTRPSSTNPPFRRRSLMMAKLKRQVNFCAEIFTFCHRERAMVLKRARESVAQETETSDDIDANCSHPQTAICLTW